MTYGINKQIIQNIVIGLLENTDFFLVGIEVQSTDRFTVKIDHVNRSITIDDCVHLSRNIQEQIFQLNSDADIELTVSSCGIGQSLTDIRQLLKLQGKSIEVLPHKGSKILAVLDSVTSEGQIIIGYDVKEKTGEKKRPTLVKKTETLSFSDVVWIKEHI